MFSVAVFQQPIVAIVLGILIPVIAIAVVVVVLIVLKQRRVDKDRWTEVPPESVSTLGDLITPAKLVGAIKNRSQHTVSMQLSVTTYGKPIARKEFVERVKLMAANDDFEFVRQYEVAGLSYVRWLVKFDFYSGRIGSTGC